jgi:hypothetical protein
MSKTTDWKMNDTQKAFTKVLEDNREAYPDGMTLREIKKVSGIEFKTGSINTLKTKGIVNTDGKREFDAQVVYDGEVIGKKHYADTVYKLITK